jgi:radical SAM protein with 4Fe4S-binding SPASM domain
MAILYDKVGNVYVVLEDIFAEMFSVMMNEADDSEFVIHKIMNMYEVDYETVSGDFAEFYDKLSTLLSTDNVKHQVNVNVDKYDETENYVFDLMSERHIPFTANIEITDRCNLECLHCYRSQESQNLWNVENFEKTLQKLKELGTLHIVFAGSEPMMHPDIVRFIELVAEYGFVLTLQSNVTILNDEIFEALKKCTVKMVFVSLYSGDAAIHERITRREGSYEKTINAIKRLTENKFVVRASVSIFDVNKDQVLAVHDLCKNLGIQAGYNFKIIPAIDKNKDTIALNCFDKEEMLRYITNPKLRLYEDAIKRSREKEGIIPEHYCYSGFRSITITYDLDVVICNAYRKKCGSLLVDDIEDIWNSSEVLIHWRSKGSLVNAKCKACKAYQYCEPCPAHQYARTGKDDVIDEITCMYGKMFWEVCEQAKAL